ncbi:MAG: hypothetical protein JST31_09220 [Actinobacteria bacterium]|nr:hypothetical protein [Actinomycetota bacterium]
MPSKLPFLIASCAIAALFLLPGTAAATVYCVDTTPGDLSDNKSIDASCETGTATLTSGLALAETHPGTDSVLVGPGNYVLAANPGGPEANYSEPGQVVHVRGIGSPHLTMGGTTGTEYGIAVTGAGGTTVEDLALTVPANSDSNAEIGIKIVGSLSGDAVGRNLSVDAPAGNNTQGIMLSRAKLVDSRVKIPLGAPTSTGVAATDSNSGLVGDEIEADIGVNVSSNEFTIERSRLYSWRGAQIDSGTLVARDSLIRLQPRSSAIGIMLANDNKGIKPINGAIEGVTIVGGAVANSVGIRVQANLLEETADATIADTVIAGPAKALQVWSDAGREAKATVSYSNYNPATVEVNDNLDGAGATGTSIYLPSNVSNLAPNFVDPAAGDFRLAAGSPLLDVGDPAAPAADAVDLAGNSRAIAAVCGGAPRRDIGAYEHVPTCLPPGEGGSGAGAGTPGGELSRPQPQLPNTTIRLKGKPRVATAGRTVKVTVTLGSSVSGASFRCQVDRKTFRGCGATFSTRLGPGRHRIRAVAVSATGADPTPAVVKLTVVRKADG